MRIAQLAAILPLLLCQVPAARAQARPPVAARTCADWQAHQGIAPLHAEELGWVVSYIAGGNDGPGPRLRLPPTPAETEKAMDAHCRRDARMPLRTAALTVVFSLAFAGH